jgi:uncharacterized membrane protein YhaH (DUF805 family)
MRGDQMAAFINPVHSEHQSMNFPRTCISFSGRLNRGQYIGLSFATLLPLTLVALLEKASGNSGADMIALVVVLLTLWVALASLVNRFHNIGWNGLACLTVRFRASAVLYR